MGSLLGTSQNLSRNCVFSSRSHLPTSLLLGYISKQNKRGWQFVLHWKRHSQWLFQSQGWSRQLNHLFTRACSPRKDPTWWMAPDLPALHGHQPDCHLGVSSKPPIWQESSLFLLPTRVRNTTLPRVGDPRVTGGLKRSISYLDLQPWNRSLGGKGKQTNHLLASKIVFSLKCKDVLSGELCF